MANISVDMARGVRVLPRPFKLQCCKLGGEASHDARHFPRPLPLHRSAFCAALARAIVLAKAAGRVRCAANVVGLSVFRPQQVAAVESWYRSAFNLKGVRHHSIEVGDCC